MKNGDMQRNLYRILRMNIILAKSSGEIVTEDTLHSFDEAARKIDDEDNLKYEDSIKDLYFTTKTLEEEKERLVKLIAIIDKRLEERKNLVVDYRETTSRNLEALGYIKDEERIDEYKERLNNIDNYLSNKDKIVGLEEELKTLHQELETCYNNKQIDENNNFELEDELLLTFKNIVTSSSYADVLKAVDVDFELEKLRPSVEEAQKTLSTFDSAFNNLKKAGIAFDSELEYSSYVDEARKAYYQVKEKEFLYRIYKVIVDSKNIYTELYEKRGNLDYILNERLHLRVELGIDEVDLLNDLYSMIDKQNMIILKQKENIDRISEIEEVIKYREDRLAELKEDNQRVEILSLLQEFGIIDVYETPEVNEKVEEKIEIKEEEPKEEKVLIPNMVVEVKEPYDYLNLSFARSKADTVMRRVGKSLGYVQEPKKESLVTFDFDKPKVDDDTSKEEIKVTNEVANNDLVDNSDLLGLKEEPKIDTKINEPTFPKIEASTKIDNDFWSVDDIFPNMDSEKDYKVNQEQSGFKLGSPIELGGNNESGN